MSLTLSKQTAYAAMLDPVMAVAKQTAYLVMLPAPDVYNTSISFSGELALSITTTGALQYYSSITFRGELQLGLAGDIFPPFRCAAPAPKTWTRNVPEVGTWACATVTPALECEGVETSLADVLAYVDGDILVDVDGYRLKVI